MRVVIAEDQALLRQGIVRLLADAGFEVVAEAADAPDLLRKVAAHKPDVAIVDVQMPPDNTDDGLRAAMEIRETQPTVGVLVLSQYAEERYAVDLIGANAEGVGYLLKDRVTDFSGFAEAVRRVGSGGSRARSDGRRPHARPPPPQRPGRRPDAPRARGPRIHGRRSLEQGHRREARRHPPRRREARHQHLQQARRGRRRRGPPARPRRARVPTPARSGIRARTSVPSPGGLRTSSVPSSAPTRSPRPRRPEPLDASAPPIPSSRTSITACAVLARDGHHRVRRVGVLGDVGQRFGDDEVGRGLDRAREPFRQPALELDRHRRAAGERLQGGVQPALGEHGGMDARREIAQLVDRLPGVGERAVDELASAVDVGGEALARELELDHQRDEPLLGAVVEVAPEPSAFRVARLDDPRARGPQRLQPGPQLDLQARVLHRQRGGRGGVAQAAPATRTAPRRGRARRCPRSWCARGPGRARPPGGPRGRRTRSRASRRPAAPDRPARPRACPARCADRQPACRSRDRRWRCGRTACARARAGTPRASARTRRRTRSAARRPTRRPSSRSSRRHRSRGSPHPAAAPAPGRGAGPGLSADGGRAARRPC